MPDQPYSSTDINLVTILRVINKWKKNILAFVFTAVILAAVITLFLPKKYYSSATIYPTNPQLSDKSRLFNNNVEALYSVYGDADDLDRLYTIANTGTMYRFIADSFGLVKENVSAAAKEKVTSKLKKHISLKKTENGELVIGVWSKDPKLSANIANAIISRIASVHKKVIYDFNYQAILTLQQMDNAKAPSDTVNDVRYANEELINEMKLSASAAPSPFIVLDHAVPASRAGRPRLLYVLASTFIVSLLFAILFALFVDRNRILKNG